MQEFIPYLLRAAGSPVLHIGANSGVPLCGVPLGERVQRVYLPDRLGPSHGICSDCKAIYEEEKKRLTRRLGAR
jgi:hypothetical protein